MSEPKATEQKKTKGGKKIKTRILASLSKKKQKTLSTNPCSRRWAFTLYPEKCIELGVCLQKNEDTGETVIAPNDLHILTEAIASRLPHLRGMIISAEEGDSKEHLHLQGYMEFSHPIRFSGIQKSIECGIHLELARGDREDNRDYILHQGKHKDKGVLHCSHVWGLWPDVSGTERNMYDEAVAMVLEGQSLLSIARAYKGAILPMLNNLARLQTERERYDELDIAYLRKQEAERNKWEEWTRKNNELPY